MTFERSWRHRVLRARLGDWRYRALLLAAALWRRLLFRTTVVAVTGSLGKTTAKEMLAAILQSLGPIVATARTSNRVADVARTILQARPWHRFVVLEVGTDRPGLIRRSAFIANPDIALILNVARTHTNTFCTLENTAREKASLLSGLRRRGTAVLNLDDPRVAAMADGLNRRVVRYALKQRADIAARDVSAIWPQRLALTLTTHEASERVQTRLVGAHWTNSVLGAAAAALQCGATLAQAAASIAQVSPTAGRLDPRQLPSGAIILRDDFNGSIDSFAPAMDVLRQASARRKILAITTISDSSESWDKRLRRLAIEAHGIADVLVLIGRPKDTRKAEKAAIADGFASDRLHCLPSIAAAADFFRDHLREGDLMLLRGTTKDHVGRIYHSQVREVQCWLERCGKMINCDDCPELFGAPAAFGGFLPSQAIKPCVGAKG